MMSAARKFIYIHVPKTGGNSIQNSLQPFSDDKKSLSEHQDGVDRFNLTGPITSTKHMTLDSYRAALGDVTGYFVFFSARHPFHRAISAYFSPNKWARKNSGGQWEIGPPKWDYSEFLAFASETKPIVSYISLDNRIYAADAIIRFESLSADYERLKKALNIPEAASLGRFNCTAAQPQQIESILGDKTLRQAIEDQFSDDMAFLGY